MSLHDKLKSIESYPFHMPGHKRNNKFGIAASEIDITEIDGFDNLHSPNGVIKEIEDKLAKIYKARRSFISVNGSSIGILA
ncbi:MAG: decarboxylase, partial [Eubacterium sp.]